MRSIALRTNCSVPTTATHRPRWPTRRVDAAMALRAREAGHTICELLHISVDSRDHPALRAGSAQDPEEGDWPVGAAVDEARWTAIVGALDAANADLLAAVEKLDDAVLDERIGDARDRALGSGVSRYVTLHGLVQHHVVPRGTDFASETRARPDVATAGGRPARVVRRGRSPAKGHDRSGSLVPVERDHQAYSHALNITRRCSRIGSLTSLLSLSITIVGRSVAL